jgi:hypothetical protein
MEYEWKENTIITNYCKKFCRENYRKLGSIGYTFDDLMQECWLVYNNCQKNFDPSKSNFMTYFTRSLRIMLKFFINKNRAEENFMMSYYAPATPTSIEEECSLGIKMHYSNGIAKEAVEKILNSDYLKSLKRNTHFSNRLLCELLGQRCYNFDLKKEIKEFLEN